MSELAEYLISVTGAAIVCSGVCTLVDKKSVTHSIIRLICGVFISIIMIQPVLKLKFQFPRSVLDSFSSDANHLTHQAYAMAADEQKKIITAQTQEYIQSKLNTMQCNLKFKLTLQEEYPYTPYHIELTGSISPYAKNSLSRWLEETMGIAAEEQIWNG